MPEEVIFESEEQASREAIATHLRTVADRLDAGDALSLSNGAETLELDVPATATFEVKAERETSPSGGPAELSIEFELEWTEGEIEADGTTGLSID